MFRDRSAAGEQLAGELEEYRDRNALVLAIPRGGVEVGIRVADFLEAEFSIIITRKLPFPDNPEAGFGAIAEDGSTYMIEGAERWVPAGVIAAVKEEQIREVERRKQTLRGGEALPEIKGRTVILVDDGIAMGSTMGASILCCRNLGAGRVVAAAPVAGPVTVSRLEDEADEVVVVEKPKFFRAVARSYRNWYDVPDREVIEIIADHHRNRKRQISTGAPENTGGGQEGIWQ